MRLAIAYASATALAGVMAIRLAIFRYCLLLFFYFASFLSALIVLNFGISYLYFTLSKRSSTSTQSPPTTLRIPPLYFTRTEAWHRMISDLRRKDTSFRKPLHGAFVIDDTVNTILEFILRDFVTKWYSQISPTDELFPISVEKAIRYSLNDLVNRLKSLDLVTIVVRKLTPHLTTHMHDFRVAEIALRGLGLERSLTESAELDAMFATRYHNGQLHPAVTGTKVEEIAWLRKLVDRILPIVMPKEESSSKTVRILVREIVSNMILFPIMDMLSDPDFWNQQIDARAGTALRERKMVKQLRQVLEKQHSDTSGSSLSTTTVVTIRSMLYNTKTSKYEAFISSISKCNNLLDLKRVRSEIATQMRKIRAEVAGHNKADVVNGQKVEHLMTYLNRLASARKKADKKIALLGGSDAVSRQSLIMDGSPQELRKNPPLKEILTNPANLSYFMEFMDRRHRLVWVQFWLIVDGFKNPLEDVSDSEDEGPTGFVVEPSKGDMATFVQDAKHIYDSYFASKAIPVKDELAEAIERYLETGTDDILLYIKARRSILKAQKEVFARMKNEDYPLYLKSDLYYKSLTSVATTASPTPVIRTSSPLVPPRPSTDSDRPAALHTMHRDRGFLKRSETSGSISSIPPTLKHAVGRSRSSQSISTLADVKSPLFPDDTPEKERHSRRESVPDLFGSTSETPIHRSARDLRPDLFDITEDSSSLFEDSTHAVDEVEAALSSIVQDRDKTPASTIRRPRSLTSLDSDSIMSSEDTRKNLQRRRIFDDGDDGDFSGSEEPTSGRHSDSEIVPDSNDSNSTDVQIAPPGDLELAAKISRMSEDIDKLEAQESILKQLESKHDLTGKKEELRIVRKSLRAVERELSNARFQKSQYEAQENENRLKPGKTQVSIDSCTIGTENGKEYALYVVQVQQLADDGSFASGWVVARRYSEFHVLQQRLCARYPSVRHLEFPAKRMVLKLQKGFVEQRRLALDKYLRELIEDPIACSSRELGAFLSQQNIHMPDYNALEAQHTSDPKSAPGNFMSHIYTTVANGIDDLLSTQGMIEAVTHRLGQQVASIAYEPKQTRGGTSSIEAPPMLDAIPDLKAAGNEMLTAFTEPMCDLFIEVFELQGNNNWLRRGAIVIIMQQILGGTIERKFREAAKGLMTEEAIMNYLLTFRNTLWPDGKFRGPGIPRTAAQKAATKSEANRKLSTLLPDLASNVIGRSNSRKGARKLFAAFQNRKLNQHLIYMVVDDMVKEIFPELRDTK